MTRLKLATHSRVRPAETDLILEFARAGMSYRLIAAEVYGRGKNGKPSRSAVCRVGYILNCEGVGVSDYRNGQNAIGRATISAIRRDANLLEAIRAASGRIVTTLRRRKTG